MQSEFEQAQCLAGIGWRAQAMPGEITPEQRIGRVIAQHRAGYELHDGQRTFNAQPAAPFLRRGVDPLSRPAVGDFVLWRPASPPLIERVFPRRSVLKRGAAGEAHAQQLIACNVDLACVLMGLDGDFNPARVERYLLLIEGSGAEPVVVLTKADLAADPQAGVSLLRARLAAEIPIFAVNAKSAESIRPLRERLGPGSTGVLLGSSGAGKSTLGNTLLGEARQATAGVRAADSRGRHTTTHRALLRIPDGGCLIDTPGMRELRLTGEEEFEAGQFADLEALSQDCRFGDCAHLGEPGCAIQAALADGRLDFARWRNYLKLRAERDQAVETAEARLRARAGNVSARAGLRRGAPLRER